MAQGSMQGDAPDPGRRGATWLAALLGIVSVGIGLYVVVRPFSSLSLLVLLVGAGMVVVGVSRLVGADDTTSGLTRLVGGASVAGGIAVALWPGLTVRLLVWLVGAWLVIDGVVDIVAGFRRGTDERLASLIRGVATVLFGVLALTWPDITMLVVALVFAARLVLFGLSLIWRSIRRPEAPGTPAGPGRLRRWARVAGAVVALLVALALVGVSSRLRGGEPVVDAFYAPPADVPAEPGMLLRAEPYTRDMPDGSRAWRILYTTTRDEGVPAVASGLVVVPESAAGALPVIAWAHGTTGVAETCAPTVLATGLESGAFFIVDDVLDAGWALVATDYVGLGTSGPHPYLIGQGEARSVIDAVRAARQLDGISLAGETVVWGHSQGGNAALWTGVVAPGYSPDVPLAGVAALAPAADLTGLVTGLPDVTGGSIFASYALSAYDDIYDDVDMDDYLEPGGTVTVDRIARRCLGEPAVLTSVLSSLVLEWSMFRGDVTQGALGDHFAENTPPYSITAPLLLAQGAADSLVVPSVQDAYVEGMCAAGQEVDYRKYDGLNHVPLVEPDSPLIPELIEWTHARLAGEPSLSTCTGAK